MRRYEGEKGRECFFLGERDLLLEIVPFFGRVEGSFSAMICYAAMQGQGMCFR